MRKIIVLFIFLFLLVDVGGCGNPKNNGKVSNVPSIDFTRVQEFSRNLFINYLEAHNKKDYEISLVSIAARPANNKHFVCIYKAETKNLHDKANSEIMYGFDIIINNSGEFEVLHEGVEVDNTYLSRP